MFRNNGNCINNDADNTNNSKGKKLKLKMKKSGIHNTFIDKSK